MPSSHYSGLWQNIPRCLPQIQMGLAGHLRCPAESCSRGRKIKSNETGTDRKFCRNQRGGNVVLYGLPVCNGLERIMKEIRRRTRVVGSFPDGYSAMMLVGARLRHISTTKWGTRQYMNTCKLYEGGIR